MLVAKESESLGHVAAKEVWEFEYMSTSHSEDNDSDCKQEEEAKATPENKADKAALKNDKVENRLKKFENAGRDAVMELIKSDGALIKRDVKARM